MGCHFNDKTQSFKRSVGCGKHPGVDERLDDGSTDIDTLDAYEYTIERDFKRLTNT